MAKIRVHNLGCRVGKVALAIREWVCEPNILSLVAQTLGRARQDCGCVDARDGVGRQSPWTQFLGFTHRIWTRILGTVFAIF